MSIASPILTLLQLQKASAVRTLKEKCLGQTNDTTLRWTVLLKIIWSILLSKTWYQIYLSRHYRVVQNSCCDNASSAFISTMWYWTDDHFSPFHKNNSFQTCSTAFYSYLQILFLEELKLWGKGGKMKNAINKAINGFLICKNSLKMKNVIQLCCLQVTYEQTTECLICKLPSGCSLP